MLGLIYFLSAEWPDSLVNSIQTIWYHMALEEIGKMAGKIKIDEDQ